MSRPILHGRTAQLAAIDELLTSACAGHGGGLMIVGDPGIGKTALLDSASTENMLMSRVRGRPNQDVVAYAGVRAWSRPLRHYLTSLPSAYAGAFDFGPAAAKATASSSPTDAERFRLSAALLALCRAASAVRPVLGIIDDAQWLDRESLDALSFVGRRVANLPVALLIAARPEDRDALDRIAGLPTLPLAGLDPDPARAVLLEYGGAALPAAVQDAMISSSGGNPLVLRSWPLAIAGDSVAPLPTELRLAFLARLARLDADARRLLRLIAANGAASWEALRHAGLDRALDCLDGGELGELLRVDGDVVSFRHPLIRAAVYHGGPAPAREPAADGAWEAWTRGDTGLVHRLLRPDTVAARCVLDLAAGEPGEAFSGLLATLPRALRDDHHQAATLALIAVDAVMNAGVPDGWRRLAEPLAQVEPGNNSDGALLRIIRAAARTRHPSEAELGDLAVLTRLDDPARLGWAGLFALSTGHADLGRPLVRAAIERSRARGATGVLAWCLGYLAANALDRGQLDAAKALAEEGRALAMETGQPNIACRHAGILVTVAALRDRREQTEWLAGGLLAEAERRCLPAVAAGAHRTLGLLELGAGRPAEALIHLRKVADNDAPMADRVEASVHAGAAADDTVDRFGARMAALGPARRARTTGSLDLDADTARCRALLSEDASPTEAQAAYQRAIEWYARLDRPLEVARTHFLLGRMLRRARRASDSRVNLRAALETFELLGVPAWANRARAELRAAGTGTATTGGWARLTEQERDIVAAVREGATNKEIAARLFLSPRTIDYHLRKVFLKMGISSRTELIRLAVSEPT